MNKEIIKCVQHDRRHQTSASPAEGCSPKCSLSTMFFCLFVLFFLYLCPAASCEGGGRSIVEGGRGEAEEAGSLSAKTHVELRGETRLEAKKHAQKRDEQQKLKRDESDREESWWWW